MKLFLYTLLALALLPISVDATGSAVALKNVTDSRTSGKHFKYLRVEMEVDVNKVSPNAVGILPIQLTEAKSNLGKSLLKDEGASGANSALFFNFKPLEKDNSLLDKFYDLENPARNATSVKITGNTKVYAPTGDASERLEITNYRQHSAKPLKHKTLASRNIKLTYFTKDEWLDNQEKAKKARELARQNNSDEEAVLKEEMGEAFAEIFSKAFGGFWGGSADLTFVITDPKDQIAKIELYSADGALMETESRSSSDPKKPHSQHGFSFKRSLPQDGKLVFHFADEKSLVAVPFTLEFPLP